MVIVTYGDRFNFLSQVVSRVFEEGANQILIVDNNSVPSSKEKLAELERSDTRITAFYNEENLGSAGAYVQILKYAYERGEEAYYWFLDDDNLPKIGALMELKKAEKALTVEFQSPVLYSYRGESWQEDREAVKKGVVKGPRVNSYCGFELVDFLKSVITRHKTIESQKVNFPIVEVKWGPYGGLFSKLSNLKRIGLPNKEFFLYADDQEFTLRFSKLNIPQYLIYGSQIQDLDQSIGEGGGYFSESTSGMKLFYGVRNTVYLSAKTVDNWAVYHLNRIAFKLLLNLNAAKNYFKNPKFVQKRKRLLNLAMSDGENGILGKTFREI